MLSGKNRLMNVLGINFDMLISSAALIRDGEIVAAAAEERFTRRKQTREFPSSTVSYCFESGGISLEEVDYVASAWNPGVYFSKFNPIFSSQRRWKAEHLYSLPDNLLKHSNIKASNADYLLQKIGIGDSELEIYFVTHHRAHAANGFLLSPFEEAAILTADAQGEYETTTFGSGRGQSISIHQTILYPQSIGVFYATITDYLGYRPNSDEWKVMALASYADSNSIYYRLMKDKVIRLLPEGKFELDLTYFNGFNHEQPNLYTQKLVDVFGPARMSDQPIESRHYEIASALQRVTEETTFHMLHWLHQKVRTPNLAVSGGVFMNAVMNGKIVDNTPFENVFISSCPDDSGNALGAALYLYNHVFDKPERITLSHNYFGPKFSNNDIKQVLDSFKVEAEYIEDIARKTAEFLREGKLVGWFQGRMEFGQRALGNRSILADPRDSEVKNRVNRAVKYREDFRPFAPAVLKEFSSTFFELPEDVSVPFMEKVFTIRKEKRKEIPSVMHVDYTGRLQTVDRETNPLFYSLIEQFGQLTEVPMVLNTSFNLNGEPIVCTPKDALRTFFSCGLDILVMGNYVVKKESPS